jgi:hypothetical protein
MGVDLPRKLFPLALPRSPRGRSAGLCLHSIDELVGPPPRQALPSLRRGNA